MILYASFERIETTTTITTVANKQTKIIIVWFLKMKKTQVLTRGSTRREGGTKSARARALSDLRAHPGPLTGNWQWSFPSPRDCPPICIVYIIVTCSGASWRRMAAAWQIYRRVWTCPGRPIPWLQKNMQISIDLWLHGHASTWIEISFPNIQCMYSILYCIIFNC